MPCPAPTGSRLCFQRAMGEQCLTAPLARLRLPHPPPGGMSHPGRMRVSERCLGWSAWRRPGPGLAGALEGPCEGEGGGRLTRHLETEVQQGLVGPLPGHSQEETEAWG